ncbi:hypothetical protein DC522_20735 [Microvirga sp. KLBC 81]|nr:hypothetical protein DC522_20735 [Microvirga sp. KLBC 81]
MRARRSSCVGSFWILDRVEESAPIEEWDDYGVVQRQLISALADIDLHPNARPAGIAPAVKQRRDKGRL